MDYLRLLFLDPHTRELRRDWAGEAASAVASLRFVAGQYPDDRALSVCPLEIPAAAWLPALSS